MTTLCYAYNYQKNFMTPLRKSLSRTIMAPNCNPLGSRRAPHIDTLVVPLALFSTGRFLILFKFYLVFDHQRSGSGQRIDSGVAILGTKFF